jgi:hypothetical protein
VTIEHIARIDDLFGHPEVLANGSVGSARRIRG